MSDKKTDSGFLRWLQNVRGAVAAVVAFISLIVGFVVSMQSNASLAILISMAVGIGIVWLACFYFALFWKPEQGDKSSSIIVPSKQKDDSVATYGRKIKQRKTIRQAALGGLILVPLLSIGCFFIVQYI